MRLLSDLWNTVVDRYEERATRQMLRSLEGHLQNDIGVNRQDLSRGSPVSGQRAP
ncbi:MAG TPA: hypothetical protein VNT30_22280 [Stellaceae bacterium]|nr:hypothetical protein [Stellaceae bacterium]